MQPTKLLASGLRVPEPSFEIAFSCLQGQPCMVSCGVRWLDLVLASAGSLCVLWPCRRLLRGSNYVGVLWLLLEYYHLKALAS